MTRSRLVVADDTDFVLEVLVTRLELAGYQTFIARNGYQALRTIADVNPQGVILDIGMPELDGFGVLDALKQTPRTRDIPVLMLTARNAEPDIRRALSAGARDYLTSPLTTRSCCRGSPGYYDDAQTAPPYKSNHLSANCRLLFGERQ